MCQTARNNHLCLIKIRTSNWLLIYVTLLTRVRRTRDRKNVIEDASIYRDLPGQLSLTTKRHCTISMGPFDVIISYKCRKNALSGHKLVTELFRADLVTFSFRIKRIELKIREVCFFGFFFFSLSS